MTSELAVTPSIWQGESAFTLCFLLTLQAQARLHLRKYAEAETILLSVMEQTNSSQREALHQLSILYSHLNRTSEAVKYIKLAIRTCSETEISCVPIHAFHGDLSKDLEDLDAAILVSSA
jgi:hypothetical protein